MRRTWRGALALLLCGVVAVVLGPVPTAAASPAADAGVGHVVADLGPAVFGIAQPGFSADGTYYAFLAPAGDRCDLHLYDVSTAQPVVLTHAHVLCDGYPHWAADADTLVWQVNAAAGDVTLYAWDADPGRVVVLAPDAHAFTTLGVSADGRFMAFTGRSDSHPAPSVDSPRYAAYVFDRTSGVSLPLSQPDRHVDFGEWSPKGANFVARWGGRTPYDAKGGACLGTGSSCRVFTEEYAYFGSQWSRDGAAVIGGPGTVVYDFGDRTFTPFPPGARPVDFALFVGAGADRLLGYLDPGGVVWDRKTGAVSTISSPGTPDASPTGRYLLFHDTTPDAYRYRNLDTGATALATYRGTDKYRQRDGYWTQDGSSFLGVGPGGCSSLRQWSPATNTVSLFGPPEPRMCFAVPFFYEGPASSASGRFAVVYQQRPDGMGTKEYVADLRRHTLSGPVDGYAQPFVPAGSDVLAVFQGQADRSYRLLLVDPRPVPDVDDKPRWSAPTPANGARVEAEVGEEAHVQIGASDLQGTAVNLYFRWRDAAGVPIASAPKGWSCERRRLAAGATVADCTFAPPKDHTAVRFLDVSVTNDVTGAQSDTRSYRVGVAS